jgi:hypothetical protein
VPKGLDSISLVPTLLGKAGQQEHPYLYWEFHEGGFSQAVLIGSRWKGIRLKRRDAPIQIFDLQNDLGEQTDAAADHPDLVARVRQLFTDARTDSPLWPIHDAPAGKK